NLTRAFILTLISNLFFIKRQLPKSFDHAMKNLPFFKITLLLILPFCINAQSTQKPVLHAKNWLAITGKPLAATAGAQIFERGGNAIDAACSMLAATSTMWDVLSWGGETQALIYNPHTG